MDENGAAPGAIEKAKNGREIFSDKIADEIVAACGSGFTLEKAGALVGVNPSTIVPGRSVNPILASEWRRLAKSTNCLYCGMFSLREKSPGKLKHGFWSVATIGRNQVRG